MATQTRKTAVIRLAKVKWGTVDFGLVSDIKLNMKPLIVGRDSYGRSVSSQFDLKVEFNLLASDNDSLKELLEISRDYGTNTLYLYGYGGDISIPGLVMQFEPELNFGGQPSKIKVSFDRYISESDAISIWLASATINSPVITNVIDGNYPQSTFLNPV